MHRFAKLFVNPVFGQMLVTKDVDAETAAPAITVRFTHRNAMVEMKTVFELSRSGLLKRNMMFHICDELHVFDAVAKFVSTTEEQHAG